MLFSVKLYLKNHTWQFTQMLQIISDHPLVSGKNTHCVNWNIWILWKLTVSYWVFCITRNCVFHIGILMDWYINGLCYLDCLFFSHFFCAALPFASHSSMECVEQYGHAIHGGETGRWLKLWPQTFKKLQGPWLCWLFSPDIGQINIPHCFCLSTRACLFSLLEGIIQIDSDYCKL